MKKYFTTAIGQLRFMGFLEGLSLIILVFIAVPMKYWYDDPSLVRSVGPLHGLLFVVFVVQTLYVAFDKKWSFKNITWKVLLSCLIPFGTYYVDYKILRKMQTEG